MQISDQQNQNPGVSAIPAVAETLFAILARRFPVCMSSDEFHFYPQASIPDKHWSEWDDFSRDSVAEISSTLKEFKLKLDRIASGELTFDEQVDISLLMQVIMTITEQLNCVQPHRNHPAFYLTIIGVGLAEAIESGPQALNDRLKGLPALLRQARQNLVNVHEIFIRQGCEITVSLIAWIKRLAIPQTAIDAAIDSLERFKTHLITIALSGELLVSRELYDRIVRRHMGCPMSLLEIEKQIDNEISETSAVLENYAQKIFFGISWRKCVGELNFTLSNRVTVKQAYEECVSRLAAHCLRKGFFPAKIAEDCPVIVENVPDYMQPVRSSAAYSMPAGHPPKGGTFFITESAHTAVVASDYKFLTAHETYPGHHLLDTSRWNLKNFIRRHLEFPVFYEGWACIAEEILFDTGFFHTAFDRMLSAKRRLWRAIRGKMDLEVHMRKKSLDEAALFLSGYGMAYANASELMRKYILKPGYQLSYAIGRSCFRNIYASFIRRGGSPELFVRQVLAHGEVGFDHLTQLLGKGGLHE